MGMFDFIFFGNKNFRRIVSMVGIGIAIVSLIWGWGDVMLNSPFGSFQWKWIFNLLLVIIILWIKDPKGFS